MVWSDVSRGTLSCESSVLGLSYGCLFVPSVSVAPVIDWAETRNQEPVSGLTS